jgi:hypothetical protein
VTGKITAPAETLMAAKSDYNNLPAKSPTSGKPSPKFPGKPRR